MTRTTGGAAEFLTALGAPDAESGAVADQASAAGLWSVATALHDELPAGRRDGWAHRLHTLLQERYRHDTVTDLSVSPGLSVIHDWHRHTVLPLIAKTLQGEGQSVPFSPLARLHTAAAAGQPTAQDAWRSALYPVLLRLHVAAYDRTSAYAGGHAGARDYALSQGRSAAEADAYGHEYAELSATAGERAFAEAHALALSDALAQAYAADDHEAYAHTCPASQVRAVIRACNQATRQAEAGESAVTRLSEGFLSALTENRSLNDR